MKRWLRHAGVLIGLAATIGIGLYAARTLRQSDLIQLFAPRALTGICIATLAYSLVIPLSAAAWRRLLVGMGSNWPWSELATIMGITQLAKYLPGNVGQHVGRMAMALGRRMPLSMYLPSVLIEALLAAMAAVLVGIACASLADVSLTGSSGGLSSGAISLMTGVAVLLMLGAVYVIPHLLRRLSGTAYFKKRTLVLPGGRALRFALSIYIVNYLLVGLGIGAMAMLVVGTPASAGVLMTGAFALAWVVGFATPGAPAGLGVREGVMLAILQLKISHTDALLIVMGLRLATTAGDILCFLAALCGHFSIPRNHGATSTLRHGKHTS